MQDIIFVNGKVKHSITLDPTVWIFDDRKISLKDYFSKAYLNDSDDSDHPFQEKKKKRYKKSQWLTDSFVIPVRPFIENAGPVPDASKVIFGIKDGSEEEIPLEVMLEGVFAFSEDGKALKENGPVHFYSADTEQGSPIKSITKITIA